MKFKSIVLESFQRHGLLGFEFSPGITTIRGETDRGKSSVLRALRWACLNDLGGDEFIREGARRTKVELVVESPPLRAKIVRGKGDKGNLYSLGKQEFKAFGSGVPEAISSLLNVSEINFQGQHDAPFWFSESAGEVSRQLNAIVDLSVIDTSLAFVVAEVRRAQDRRIICVERLRSAEEEWEKNANQRERVSQFAELKQQNEKLTRAQNRYDILSDLLLLCRGNNASRLAEKAREGKELFERAQRIVSLQRQESGLQEILAGLEEQQSQAEPPPPFEEVEQAYHKWKSLSQQASEVGALAAKAFWWASSVEDKEEELKQVEAQFHEKIKGLQCPLCGSAL